MGRHLYALFTNPLEAWQNIDREPYQNNWQVLKENLGLYLFLNPALFIIAAVFQSASLSEFLKKGIIFPFVLTLASFFIITFAGLMLEEIYRLVTYKEPGQDIFKWLVFSLLPVYALSGFSAFPVVGSILLLTGIAYSGYMLVFSFKHFLWPSGDRKVLFIFASGAGLAGLAFLSIFGLILLTGASSLVKKMF